MTGLRNAFLYQVAAVEANNGMHGCKGDRPLEQEEIDFRNLVQALGVNWVTAEELFRQGISSMENPESVDADKLKTTFCNVRKNHSPSCPHPEELFTGATFENKMLVLISWTKFQRIIGGTTSADTWNQDANAHKTISRSKSQKALSDHTHCTLHKQLKYLQENGKAIG